MDWQAITAVAAVVTAISTGGVAAEKIWKFVSPRIKAWYNRIRLYSRLSAYGRDILKAIHDSETTLLSLQYDGERSIRTKLDCILDIPVACRLMVSNHYTEDLENLVSHGLLRYDDPRQCRLTDIGGRFVDKHAIGNGRVERFVRKRISGLNRHKYEGRYVDETGDETRRKLPNLLGGYVYNNAYHRIDENSYPRIYEYPPDAIEDGVECMVVIHKYLNISVKKGDRIFLKIYTDKWLQLQSQEYISADMQGQSAKIDTSVITAMRNLAYGHSNKPLYLDTDSELEFRFDDSYPVQGVVIGMMESHDPIRTILNLGRTQVFDPDLEKERNQPA